MTNLRPRSRAGAGRSIGARRRCPVGCSRTVRSGRTIGGSRLHGCLYRLGGLDRSLHRGGGGRVSRTGIRRTSRQYQAGPHGQYHFAKFFRHDTHSPQLVASQFLKAKETPSQGPTGSGQDLVRNNFLVSGAEAPACGRRFGCGGYPLGAGPNKDGATPSAPKGYPVDRHSNVLRNASLSGSYFGPNPKGSFNASRSWS